MTSVIAGGAAVEVGQATAPFGQATALPPRFYLDPALFELEQSRVFATGWVPLARAEQVAEPGTYLSVQLGSQPLVITCDAAGVPRVLANVCRHRAMPLAEGSGMCRTLRCEYHLWTYRLDGTLSGAPMMAEVDGFDRDQVRLPEFRHEIWQGWIFVNLDGRAAPLADQVSGLVAEIAEWRFSDMVSVATASYEADWNWKISVENFAEFYHHLGLHRDSLEPLLPAKTARCLDNRGQPWSSSWIGCSDDYLLVQGDPMKHLPPSHTMGMQIMCVFPLLCAGGQPASTFWLQILPISVDRHRLTWHVMVPADQLTSPGLQAFVESSLVAIEQIQEEDGAACRGVQRGLRAPATATGRLAPLELPLWQMQTWLLARLTDTTTTE
ncbi:aromatic ring-hydroxylating dioxygenase subunit alpha [Micromonospora sp. NPDC051925]|uniref:aromatic ring-hydroxylating dioxygenase subunit alpha n=1 Tax=Micromonospora sp. NPDC051925 TaxID=3364288 RepID=UPI0037CB555C